MATRDLGAVHNIALGIDADLVVHSTDAADFSHMPNFTECLVVAFCCGLYLQFLEAVFTAVLTRVRACDAFGACKRDGLRGHYRESFGGASASVRGLRRAGESA